MNTFPPNIMPTMCFCNKPSAYTTSCTKQQPWPKLQHHQKQTVEYCRQTNKPAPPPHKAKPVKAIKAKPISPDQRNCIWSAKAIRLRHPFHQALRTLNKCYSWLAFICVIMRRNNGFLNPYIFVFVSTFVRYTFCCTLFWVHHMYRNIITLARVLYCNILL